MTTMIEPEAVQTLWTVIKPDDTWMLWAVILCGVGLSIWLEQSYTWAAKLSGPLLALCFAMLLSNLRVMPPEAGVYDVVTGDLVPLAIPLLLLRANVLRIIRSTGRLFIAFNVASVGTVIGAYIAAALLHPYVESTPEVAGMMTASYIGGMVNMLAVARSYDVSGEVLNPLIVADNFIMAAVIMWLLLTCGSKWAKRWYPHPHTKDAVDSRQLAAEHWRRKEISLFDIAASLALAVTIVMLGLWSAAFVGSQLGNGPFAQAAANKFVHITALSTLVATLGHRWLIKLNGPEELGGYLLYVFLFVIGLPADLWVVISKVPLMFVFCTIMAVCNVALTFLVGRILKFNLEDMALAINASLGGPPSAAAMAVSMGWSKLVLPGLLAGLWGYTIGTALGLMVTESLRYLLGTA
jgi:uncharacterized membrane protein